MHNNQLLSYQFKITLDQIAVPVWRRIAVPSSYTFWDLHVAIQDAMGWQDCHLHEFTVIHPRTMSASRIGIPNDDYGEDADMKASWQVPISDYFSRRWRLADYTYDFGDDWRHTVVLEAITRLQPELRYPLLLGGDGACPPEDVGGPTGYAEFLEAIQDPQHPEHQDLLTWAGGIFDPAGFDANDVHFDDPKERWRQAFGEV